MRTAEAVTKWPSASVEMARLIREHDWSGTPLGSVENWPERLRGLIDLMLASHKMMCLMWGADGVLIYNDAYAVTLGPDHPAALGRPAFEVWPDLRQLFEPHFCSAQAGDEVVLQEHYFRPEGSCIPPRDTWFDLTYTPVPGADGAVLGVLVSLVEATERVEAERDRRRAEAMARENEERQAFILELSDALRAESDAEAVANRALSLLAERLQLDRCYIGIFQLADDRGRFTHQLGNDRVPPLPDTVRLSNFPAALRVAFERSLVIADLSQEGGLTAMDRQNISALGVQAIVAVTLHKGTNNPYWSLGAITGQPRVWTTGEIALLEEAAERTWAAMERARGEANLRESEARLRALNEGLEARVAAALAERQILADIVESTNAAVMACDLEYRIIAINKANLHEMERAYGKRPKVGDNLLELVADNAELKARVLDLWGRALAGESFLILEEFGETTRERISYEIRFDVLRDKQGRTIGASQTARDVTARVRAQAELEAARDALRQSQKMEAMGQLTGGVAHDFNNLLTPIMVSLDVLQSRGLGSEREQRLIAGALQSAERAKTLVQRLLAFARRQPLQVKPVDVVGLVRGMAALLTSTLGPQIALTVEAGDDLPQAKADPNQLEMALLNLAVNARDAMPEGGQLRVGLVADEVAGATAAKLGLRSGPYIRITVSDTGTGMDEATLARAVEPFFSTKGVGKGTGLGLSMVHGLASQLGGALALQSRPGFGTEVELWLPQSEEERQGVKSGTTAQADDRRGTVLLVDDEDVVRLSTADLLEDIGYHVVQAASGEEALRLIQTDLAPDLLVTDHLMPGMTGVELARAMQRLRPGIPVLIISGYANIEGLEPDLPRLAKPFRRADLVASLAGLTGPEVLPGVQG